MTINTPHAAVGTKPAVPALSATSAKALAPALVSSIDRVLHSRMVLASEDSLLTELANRLLACQSAGIVVCNRAGEAVGLVTESVLVAQFGVGQAHVFSLRAAEAMRRDFASCHATDVLADAIGTMQRQGLGQLVVLDEQHHPVGVLLARDGLRALLADGNYEHQLLRNYVTGVGYQ